jgi:secreted trypsin-like serine protease
LLKRITLVLAVIASLVISAGPANAITDGELDSGAHPYVGLMVALRADSLPLWRCSGTLISPTIFVTAGHCTEAPAAKAVIYFSDVVVSGTGGSAPNICTSGRVGYPCNGGSTGTTYTHPDYDPNAFFVRDMGIVVLDAPAPGITTFGSLPGLNSLDGLKVSSQTTFTSVGYGLQKAFPDAAAWKDVAVKERRVAHPQLVQINGGIVGDFSLLLSNNAYTGGTCFGDSGGANFLGNSRTIAGVTSFGLNSTCGGTGGIFRLDRSWSLSFAGSF